jgi:hypothetical protein
MAMEVMEVVEDFSRLPVGRSSGYVDGQESRELREFSARVRDVI